MAPTIKWQRWDSASYDWMGTAATDALPALEAELDAWITTVNGNASNTGRSIVKERGYADSTTANYAGLVISAGANGNTAKGYLAYGTYGSATSKQIYTGDTYVDDTSRGGYGTVSGGPTDTGVSWISSGQEASWVIVSNTTDGQEYFCFGPRPGNTDSNIYQEGFFIFKCTDGEWSMTANDASSHYHVHYWDDALGTGWGSCTRSTTADLTRQATSNTYGRFMLHGGTSGLVNSAGSVDGAEYVYAASPDVLETTGSSTYYFTGRRRVLTTLGDGNNVYVLNGYYFGPSFLVDLRP